MNRTETDTEARDALAQEDAAAVAESTGLSEAEVARIETDFKDAMDRGQDIGRITALAAVGRCHVPALIAALRAKDAENAALRARVAERRHDEANY